MSTSFAQNQSKNRINMFMDYSRFRYDEANTYLEIYYLLYDLQKEVVMASPKDVSLEFLLFDENNDSLLAKEMLKVKLDGSNALPGQSSNVKGSLIKTVLPVGKYKIKMVRLEGLPVQRMDSLSYIFSTPAFNQEKIALSDVELCSKIITASKKKSGLFYKNSMEVLPNPMRMYGKETPKLYYYTEIYNLKSENAQDLIDINIVVADAEGKVKVEKKYKKKRRYESSVEVGSFDVSELKNGLYTLIFAVSEPNDNYSVYTRNNFYIMNTDEEDGGDLIASFSRSEFLNMSVEELDKRFDEARYVATQNDIKIYKSLGDKEIDSKRMFLFKFWREREKDGVGLMKEYYERVDYANEHFPFANIPGWETDQGRIYVKYGEPDIIERRPNSSNNRPLELWTYHDLDGGSKFLFVDDSGFKDYRLKSSTLRGEVYDPQYDQLLIYEQF